MHKSGVVAGQRGGFGCCCVDGTGRGGGDDFNSYCCFAGTAGALLEWMEGHGMEG